MPCDRAGHVCEALQGGGLFHTCRYVCVCVVQEPVERHVIEQGMFVKHFRAEVCSTPVDMSVCVFVVQEPVEHHVIEQGMFVKHCKVEVYLMDLKLSENSDINTVVTKQFSRAATIGEPACLGTAVVVVCMTLK